MSRMPVSANIKITLVLLASGIVIAVLLYTNNIVQKLQQREKKIADLYAKALKSYSTSDMETGSINLVFEIARSIDFPIILTDPKNEISSYKNIEIDSTLNKNEAGFVLKNLMQTMKQKHQPIIITFNDSIITNYFYYDESRLVGDLRRLPYYEIIVAGMFIFIGYIGFSYIRRSEQSNIWVGMSKETAHQLGTPLSSLLGWIELMKAQIDDPAQMRNTIQEMENDVERLNKIAMRFSKIGSRPDLKNENLIETISKVIDYFRKRIPQMEKRVDITLTNTEPVYAKINSELFEWVLENLIKNGLDAMESGVGKISVTITTSGKYVFLDVHDTGKGIDTRFKKDIFRPGFSTKKRGWGLGLSLSKRIIENYHRGKLGVLETGAGKGTTFRIKLHT